MKFFYQEIILFLKLSNISLFKDGILWIFSELCLGPFQDNFHRVITPYDILPYDNFRDALKYDKISLKWSET